MKLNSVKYYLIGILSVFGALLSLTGCMNDHSRFCTEASDALCTKCAECGYEACGLKGNVDATSCRETFFRICEAYEPDFNKERARNCLSQIRTATCSEPKPEMCSKLF